MPYVQLQGRYLWKDGERVGAANTVLPSMRVLTMHKFFVKGVVYQANHSDDFSLWGRDLISDDRLAQLEDDVHLFQELGINTILICKSARLLDWTLHALIDETRLTTQKIMLRL
jgi:hypothetical protein